MAEEGTIRRLKNNSAQQSHRAENSACSNSQVGKPHHSQDIVRSIQNNLASIIESSTRLSTESCPTSKARPRKIKLFSNNLIASQEKKSEYL